MIVLFSLLRGGIKMSYTQKDIMNSIELCRKQLGFTQREFAEIVDISPSTSSKLKYSHRSLYAYEGFKLSNHFNISVNILLNYND